MTAVVKEMDVHKLDAEATAALDEARNMPPGPDRTEALKKAGILRQAADLHRPPLAKRGRPRKYASVGGHLMRPCVLAIASQECRACLADGGRYPCGSRCRFFRC